MDASTTQPEQPTAAPRYHALDSLRAGLMLLGLALHAATSYTSRPLGDAWPYNDGAGSRLFDCIVLYTHLFRMPLFFVLSGFFGALLCERRGLREFARNRVWRIGLPLVASWLVTFPLVKSGFVYAINAHGPDARTAALHALRSPFTGAEFKPGSFVSVSWLHLWFLYYLVWFYAGAITLNLLFSRLPEMRRNNVAQRIRQNFRCAMQSRFRVLWLAVPTFAVLATMPLGILETDPNLFPAPRILIAYALFFAFGWLWHGERDLLKVGAKSAKWGVAVTVPLFLVLLVTALKISPELTIDFLNRLVLAACGSLICALLIFAVVGLAMRHAARPSRIGRYLADSSYWLYLAHLPVVVWLVAVLANVALPSFFKFLLVLTGTTAATLVTYNWFVRSTWIGLVLNGRRYARGLPPEDLTAALPAQAVVMVSDANAALPESADSAGIANRRERP